MNVQRQQGMTEQPRLFKQSGSVIRPWTLEKPEVDLR